MEAFVLDSIAGALIAAYDNVSTLPTITSVHPDFDVHAAYRVLRIIEARRRLQGWRPVGRKIGFTNRALWPRYGVDRPLWAHVFSHTLHIAENGRSHISLGRFVQPRIEPEVVFGLDSAVPSDCSARRVLDHVDWIAPGFEIVQCHFPDWTFTAADCTAAFGLHGALIIGERTALDAHLRDRLDAVLPRFELTLMRAGDVIDRGRGANVLGSPALALGHLVQLLAGQDQSPALGPGEIVTTGTLTDAWPVRAGESWSSDYGELDIPGLEITFD